MVMTKNFYNKETGEAAVFEDDARLEDFPAFQENPIPVLVTAENIRFLRDLALATTDWMAMSDRVMTQAESDYRQELRDLPTTADFVEGRFNDILIPPPPTGS